MNSVSRVTVRALVHDDAAALSAYRSDPAIAAYQSWKVPFTIADAKLLIAGTGTARPDEPGWIQYGIDLDGTLIGDVGVNLHDNRMQAAVGVTIARAFQRRGYATDVAVRVLGYLLADPPHGLGMHRISAECDARNTASAALLRRLGFVEEGLRREHTWVRGEWTDDRLFGLLADSAPARALVARTSVVCMPGI